MNARLLALARLIAPGTARGRALVLDEPLSFWGGLDPSSGRIMEPRHPQHGVTVSGRVLFMSGARGSSSSASILAEAVRAGTAPAAIVLGEQDLILALGAAVAEELYGHRVPIAVVEPAVLSTPTDGEMVTVGAEGVAAG